MLISCSRHSRCTPLINRITNVGRAGILLFYMFGMLYGISIIADIDV